MTYWCSLLLHFRLSLFMMGDNVQLITVKQGLGNYVFGDGGGGYLVFKMSYHYSRNNIWFNQLFLQLVQCGV